MEINKQKKLKKWITLIAVAFAGGLITKLPYLRETYMDPLQLATGTTKEQLGLIMSSYGVVSFICYFPGGILADKFSCKKLIVFACFLSAIIGLWYWTLPGFVSLVVIHGLLALAAEFIFWAAMIKSVNRLGGPEEQGRLFGALEGGRGLIGTLVAFGSVAAFGLAVDDIGGMKNSILFYSIMLVVAGILVLIFLENDIPVKIIEKKKKTMNFSAFLSVAKMPRVWLCGVLGMCNFSALIFHGYVTPYLTDAFGLSSTVVANLSIIRTYFMMMIGAVIAGVLSDKIGSRIKFIFYAFIGMTIFATLYVLIPAGSNGIPLIIANFIVYGLCLYSIKALYFSTIDEVYVPKKLVGTASGIISMLTYGPQIFLYSISGSMIDKYEGTATPLQGYIYCFIAMAVLSAIGFICGFILHRLNKKPIIETEVIENL